MKKLKRIGLIIVIVMLLSSCTSKLDSSNDKGEVITSGSSRSDISEETSGESSKGGNVQKQEAVFEDPNFERYIRSYLGKSSDEVIPIQELSEMTELVIDRRFVEIDTDDATMKNITLMRIDLSDLKYFPNLTKLEIKNEIGDILYSLDAIGNCTKLTELSLRYNIMINIMGNNKALYTYSNDYGYKTLFGILEKLPELKKLDLGIQMPEAIMKKVQDNVPGVTIINAVGYNNLANYSDYENLLTKVTDMDSLSADTTVINLSLEGGEDVNEAIKKAADFEKLSILRVITNTVGDVIDLTPLSGHTSLEEIVIGTGNGSLNENSTSLKGASLSVIPNLKYLTFLNLKLSDQDLSAIKSLKTLDLYHCDLDGYEFLSSCTELYGLKLRAISSSEVTDINKESLIRGMKSQIKLQYLTVSMTGGILSYCPEALEKMTELKDFTTMEAGNEEYFKPFKFNQNKKLKRLVLYSLDSSDTYDLSAIEGLTNLEVLWIPSFITYQNEEALLSLHKLKFFRCQDKAFGDNSDPVGKLKVMSSKLVQLPELSAVTYDYIWYITVKSSNTIKEVDASGCRKLYDTGIVDSYYGLLEWIGKMEE
jgi:hypothetical protein